MRNNIMRIKLTFLACLIILNLIGCSSEYSNKVDPKEQETYLKFAIVDSTTSSYKAIIDKFEEENPSINIELVPLPISYWLEGHFSDIASMADVFLLNGNAQIINSHNALLNLGPLIQSDTTFDSSDFWYGILNDCSDEKGNQVGLPSTLNIFGIFVENDVINNLNGNPPAAGWTVSDFKDFLTNVSLDGTRLPVFKDYPISSNSNMPYPNLLAPFIDENLVSVQSEQDKINNILKELSWYVDYSQSGIIQPSINMDHPNEVASSLEQRPPMWVDTLASPLLANEATSFFSNYSYFPFPVSDGPNGSSNTTPVISTCIVASSGTQYKEPAWKWINYLSQQLINTDTGATNNGWVIPARQSVAQNNEIWNSIPENAKSLIEFSVEHAWFGSKVPSMTYLVNSTLTNPNTTSQSLEKDFAYLFAETPIVAPTENRTPVFVEPFQTDEKSSEQLTIKFYTSVTNENEERWESLVNQFHETHSTINITLPPANEGIPLVDDYEEYLSNNYDCFVWNTDDMLNSQGTQNLVDISPLLSIENSSFVNDFDKETLGSYEFNNYLLGLPTSTELTLISYNEDLLQELGISEPYEDWDYSEFIRLANIVSTKPGYYGFLFASWDVDFFLSSQNASLIPDPSRLSVAINSPEIKSAVQEFLGLVKINTFFPLTGDRQNSVEAQQLITSGKVAFWTSTSGNPENWYFLQNNGSIFNIGINPLPVTSQPITQSTTANLGAFISKKGDNQQVCWEWIKYLSENATSLDGIPLRNSVRDSSNWEATVGSKNAEIYRIAYEQGEFRKYNWKIVGVIQGIFLQALYSILDGKDISSELYTSQAKADQFINCISPYANSFSDSIDQAVLDQCSLQ